MSDVCVLHRVGSEAAYSTWIHVSCAQKVKVTLEMKIAKEHDIVRIIN
jgi:hypothetical protein